MKLKYEFEAVDMGDEIILVPVGDGAKKVSGVFKLNASALEIVGLLKSSTSEDSIVDALAAKYENARADLQGFVRDVLEALRDRDLIEE